MSIALKLKGLLQGEAPVPMSSSELLALAAGEPVHEIIDFGLERDLGAIPRLVRLILYNAIIDNAEQIRFFLKDKSSKEGLQITVFGHNAKTAPAAMHGCIYCGILVALCNHAALSYYTKGRVTGIIRTSRPHSVWLLEADDLQMGLILSRSHE